MKFDEGLEGGKFDEWLDEGHGGGSGKEIDEGIDDGLDAD